MLLLEVDGVFELLLWCKNSSHYHRSLSCVLSKVNDLGKSFDFCLFYDSKIPILSYPFFFFCQNCALSCSGWFSC